MTKKTVQQATEDWIERVVIGYNFCPFARRVVLQRGVEYIVSTSTAIEAALLELVAACRQLDKDPSVVTSFLIFETHFADFENYLDGVAMAETLLIDLGYEGVYQLATFHPAYQFAGEDPEASSHYTNRSPYPMWHLLREDSLEKALEHYPNPEAIPERNAVVAAEQSPETWAAILSNCYTFEQN